MHYHVGNLLESVKSGVIVHGCNMMGVMGAGFALQVAKQYPKALQEYRNALHTRNCELGDVIYHEAFTGDDIGMRVIIANALTQVNCGRAGVRYVSYDAIDTAMNRVFTEYRVEGGFGGTSHGFDIHMPKIGAGLAGGNWKVIEAIIFDQATKQGVSDRVHIWSLE